MTLRNFKLVDNFRLGFIKLISLIFFTGALTPIFAQDNDFELLSEDEILHFRYEIYAESIGLFFYHIPPDLEYRRILIGNKRNSCFVGHQINSQTFTNRQILIELCSDWMRSDTIFIFIEDDYTGINYVPKKIIPGVTSTEVKMGADCYKLRCEPENDPWMPNGNIPFLFSRYDYYVNPKNGKAKKGETILNSGIYSACELENWALVYSDDIDSYKENWKLKKKEARQNRKK